jgi:hypothetical protein
MDDATRSYAARTRVRFRLTPTCQRRRRAQGVSSATWGNAHEQDWDAVRGSGLRRIAVGR